LLTEDEFRLLAFARAYADQPQQHLVPTWLGEQLGLTLTQSQEAARGLAARGLAEFFEGRPDDANLVPPEFGDGPMPMDLKLTPTGVEFPSWQSGYITWQTKSGSSFPNNLRQIWSHWLN
jgi:hypothetical protein